METKERLDACVGVYVWVSVFVSLGEYVGMWVYVGGGEASQREREKDIDDCFHVRRKMKEGLRNIRRRQCDCEGFCEWKKDKERERKEEENKKNIQSV